MTIAGILTLLASLGRTTTYIVPKTDAVCNAKFGARPVPKPKWRLISEARREEFIFFGYAEWVCG